MPKLKFDFKYEVRGMSLFSPLPAPLQVLARAGVASRRAAEEIIVSGKVRVNGEVVLVPQHQVIHNVDNVRGSVLMSTRTHSSWSVLRLMSVRSC